MNENKEATTQEATTNAAQYGYLVSIVENANGEKWVHVQCAGEDFVVAPHDLTDANGDIMANCTQPDLMARLKELHLDTFNRRQGVVITLLVEEINAALESIGGEPFASDWYASSELWKPVGSSADYHGSYSWYFNGYNGCFINHDRYGGYFRSRPVLAFAAFKH